MISCVCVYECWCVGVCVCVKMENAKMLLIIEGLGGPGQNAFAFQYSAMS